MTKSSCNFFDIFELTADKKYKSRINLKDKNRFFPKGTIFDSDSRLFNGFLCFYEYKSLLIEEIEDSIYEFSIGICKNSMFLNVEKEKNLFRFAKLKYNRESYENGSFRIKPSLDYIRNEYNNARKDNEHVLNINRRNAFVILESGEKTPIDNMVESHTDRNINNYILCMAYEFDENLFSEFESDTCLVITDTNEFERRLSKVMKDYDLIGLRVFYNNILHPYGPVFNKSSCYKIQKEFRYSWLNYNNPIECKTEELIHLDKEILLEKIPKYIDIEIGSLEDISFLIDIYGNRIDSIS